MNVLELNNYVDDETNDNPGEDDDDDDGADGGDSEIKVLEADYLDYSEFYVKYLFSNRPCLIKSVSKNWEAQKKWIKNGKPNFEYLEEKYGLSEVPVANCKERYFNVQSRTTMGFKDYLSYWKQYILENYPEDMPCLYLKDWHLANEFPSDNIYRVPFIFASDWINEYLINSKKENDDYRFVYFGPKGSWTPLHTDVFSSFSWSVNLCGRKKWVFYQPRVGDLLKDKFGNLPYDVKSSEFKDYEKYPGHRHLSPIVLIQEDGDAVFVPSGWYHQVWNLDDTISINHNWVNACNVNAMWCALNKIFQNAQKEISDCRGMGDWDTHSQLMLKLCFGMDHADFVEFLFYIAEQRLYHVSKGSFLSVPGDWLMGCKQMAFDLSSILPILEEMLKMDVSCLDVYKEKLQQFIVEINSVCSVFNAQQNVPNLCTRNIVHRDLKWNFHGKLRL